MKTLENYNIHDIEAMTEEALVDAIKKAGENLALWGYDIDDDEEENKMWYAVLRDREDNDWGTGSYDLEEAKQMCKDLGKEAYIAVIEEGNDPVCIEEIFQDQF